MKDINEMKHFHLLEQIVNNISKRTRRDDTRFFEIMTCHALMKLPSMMNVRVDAFNYGNHNINMYGVAFASSGFSKGYASRILKSEITQKFFNKYRRNVAPFVIDANLRDIANKRAASQNLDPDETLLKVQGEYNKTGEDVYEFDSGSPEGIKQQRERILMGGIGALNYEVDEMASKFMTLTDIDHVFLDLFDGSIGTKLTKNTQDNKRSVQMFGQCPTNLLLFGEDNTLFDGGSNEKTFLNFLNKGYARRSWFGTSEINPPKAVSVDKRLREVLDISIGSETQAISDSLAVLADDVNAGVTVTVSQAAMRLLVEYELYCETEANKIPTTTQVNRIFIKETQGRYFKAIRVAGGFAWLDNKRQVEVEHIEAAIKLAEMSGKCLRELLSRPPVYARLAQYLALEPIPKTHADLMENLPFYPSSGNQQRDMLKFAISWGYKNNVVITRYFQEDIEFIKGEALQETNLDELRFSYSREPDGVNGYKLINNAKLDKLHNLTQNPYNNWCVHGFTDGYRHSSKVAQGFNLIVIDVDGGYTIAQAKELFQNYVYHIYTTKSHKKVIEKKNPKGEDRFRIILVMSHMLKLNADDYKQFMANVHSTLPFKADTQTGEIARKWECAKGEYFTNTEGKLFDVLPMIPKSRRCDERDKVLSKINHFDNLERWFYIQIVENGNRNNYMIRFALMLVSHGHGVAEIVKRVKDLNAKLPDPMEESELNATVFQTVKKRSRV